MSIKPNPVKTSVAGMVQRAILDADWGTVILPDGVGVGVGSASALTDFETAISVRTTAGYKHFVVKIMEEF